MLCKVNLWLHQGWAGSQSDWWKSEILPLQEGKGWRRQCCQERNEFLADHDVLNPPLDSLPRICLMHLTDGAIRSTAETAGGYQLVLRCKTPSQHKMAAQACIWSICSPFLQKYSPHPRRILFSLNFNQLCYIFCLQKDRNRFPLSL